MDYSLGAKNNVKCMMYIYLLYVIIMSSFGQFSRSVMSDSFVTPWTAAHQASLSIINS